jgi:hypothetical protein
VFGEVTNAAECSAYMRAPDIREGGTEGGKESYESNSAGNLGIFDPRDDEENVINGVAGIRTLVATRRDDDRL